MGIDREDPREQEALRMMARKELSLTNEARAEIIIGLRGGDDKEKEEIITYLTEVDESFLDWVVRERILEELEDILDEIEWEIGNILVIPNLKNAFERVIVTAEKYGEAVKDLETTDDLILFKHLISEIRTILLMLREQNGDDSVQMIVASTKVRLGISENILMQEESESESFQGKKLLKTIIYVGEGVDPLIAAKRATVESLETARKQVKEKIAEYEGNIRLLYGLKDEKLPV